jgi:immunoglobulin-binding protein 1
MEAREGNKNPGRGNVAIVVISTHASCLSQVLRKRRGQEGSTLSSGDLALIASLLPTHSVKAPAAPAADDEDEDFDSSTSELLRNTTLLLLRLTYAHARSRLDSAEQEAALLEAAPPPMSAPPADDSRVAVRQAESDMWRLDQPAPAGGPDGRGPLLDSSGRPLRPFTILPAGAGGASDRARLAGQVFGPSHRLPSMSVDEYLQIEAERGNIISGGGQASEERLTTSEQLALDAEQDGTAFGEQREEERRMKDEEWAQYTDANPKGAGNTMNRG